VRSHDRKLSFAVIWDNLETFFCSSKTHGSVESLPLAEFQVGYLQTRSL
jgi:hypothetical protein